MKKINDTEVGRIEAARAEAAELPEDARWAVLGLLSNHISPGNRGQTLRYLASKVLTVGYYDRLSLTAFDEETLLRVQDAILGSQPRERTVTREAADVAAAELATSRAAIKAAKLPPPRRRSRIDGNKVVEWIIIAMALGLIGAIVAAIIM